METKDKCQQCQKIFTSPELDWEMLDMDTGENSDWYNNPPAGALLSGAENFVKEPPAPAYLCSHCAAVSNFSHDLEVRSRGKRIVARSDNTIDIRRESAVIQVAYATVFASFVIHEF